MSMNPYGSRTKTSSSSRRTKLYLYRNSLLCRECYPVPIYRSIKNVTPGGHKYISHKLKSLAKHERVELKRFPFCYLEYSKQKYRHFEKWHMEITKLQALENMRNQAIFFRKVYSLNVIYSVLKEENTFCMCVMCMIWTNIFMIGKRAADYFQGTESVMKKGNLVLNSGRSLEELREMGRKGGIASGKARRKRRDTLKMAKLWMEVLDELERKDRAQTKRLMDRLVKEAMKRG